MIVISIIGILASVAIPKFVDMIRKTQEAACKGNLGAIRSALKIYYGEMEGQFPGDLASLAISVKYLDSIPPAKAPNYHAATSAALLAAAPDDSGGWLYDNTPSDANYATVVVNCTHTDSKGTVWTLY